jgi:hypothetical protein
MEARYAELRRAVEETAAVDAHAHNLVAVDSSFPFLRCFSEADGDALAFAPLSFKVQQAISLHSALLRLVAYYPLPSARGGVR